MTEKLYLYDSYLKSIDSVLTGKNGNVLTFDRTIFYPTGGGQPSDRGKISCNGNSYEITDVRKNGDEVEHIVSGMPDLENGEKVHMEIDWNSRYMHMRFHTAIHIIDAAVRRMNRPGILITGSQIYDDHARVDFDFESFDSAMASEIIGEANGIVSSNTDVRIREIGRDEALQIPELARTEPGKRLIQSLEKVRIIEIVGVDMQADGGTHVAKTSEVGKIMLRKIQSKGRRNKRMEIYLD